MVGNDELSEVLDYQCKLPGIFLFKVAFPQDQIVEPW